MVAREGDGACAGNHYDARSVPHGCGQRNGRVRDQQVVLGGNLPAQPGQEFAMNHSPVHTGDPGAHSVQNGA